MRFIGILMALVLSATLPAGYAFAFEGEAPDAFSPDEPVMAIGSSGAAGSDEIQTEENTSDGIPEENVGTSSEAAGGDMPDEDDLPAGNDLTDGDDMLLPEEEAPEDQFLRELADPINYTAEIDLSYPNKNATGTGYTIQNAVPYNPSFDNPVGNIIFSAASKGHTYRLYQTGQNSNAPAPPEHKKGSSTVGLITLYAGADITLVIDEIYLNGGIYMLDGSKLNLVFENHSFMTGSIIVPSEAEITIDSLTGNDYVDRLTMKSVPNTANPRLGASIGGSGRQGTIGNAGGRAGKITINGGGLTIIARSSGACIGGGGAVPGTNGSGGNGGKITINGGTLDLTQYGVNDNGNGLSGACIGGGGNAGSNPSSSDNNTGNGGTIEINGGSIRCAQFTGAAGIGGGKFGTAGNITINNGAVDVLVCDPLNGSGINPGAGEGSGIGASTGTCAPGPNNITITGGVVSAVNAHTGGAGIGISNSGQACHILITGGMVYAKGSSSPGIGFFSESRDGTITIIGATVVAESDKSAGIGGPYMVNEGGSVYEPGYIHIGSGAKVWAYSGGKTPAIYGKDNAGDGFYVNASFAAPPSPSSDMVMRVYEKDGDGRIVKLLNLPKNYRHFAYTTDSTVSCTDKIIGLNSDQTVRGIVVRVYDDSRDIYSVKTNNGYDAHGKIVNALPVKFDETPIADVTVSKTVTGLFADKTKDFTFTVYFMDAGGNPLTNLPPIDYTGGTLTGSGAVSLGNGSLSPNAITGQAVFTLKHGQMVTLNEISANMKIRIEETEDSNYRTSYKDSISANSVDSNDTGPKSLSAGERTFAFTNERIEAVPTGIDSGSDTTAALLLTAVLTIMSGWVLIEIKRRKKAWQSK